MQYLGDFVAGSTIRGSFNTRTAAGSPITLGGTPSLSVYKDGGTTETTTGVTLTVDFDSRTGHHLFAIATSDVFYATGSDYRIVITTGTVDGVSVVGTEVGSFSIQNRNVSGGGGGLDAAGVRAAIGLASANLDTQFSNIPTAVWSAGTRTLSSFGTLASDVATAVWAAGSRTLTAIGDSSGVTTLLSRIVGTLSSGTHNPQSGDAFARLGAPVGASISADVQTRLAAASYSAPPTATANASAVRSELTTELGRIDATVSSRLASAGYVAPANSDVAAIKAKTDQLTFTVTGQVDANALTGGLTADGIRSAVGLASANLDTQLSAIPTGVWSAATRTITGGTITTVSDKNGYSLSQAFPTNFAALGINASGHISRVTLTDTTTNLTNGGGGGGLDAAGVRAAIGLASANLDTQLAAIPSGVWANGTRTITGGTVTTVSDKTGYSLSQLFPANFASLGINASGHVSRVVLVDTCTTNTDMRGTNNALLAASYTAPANSDIAAIKAKTDNLPSDPADASDIASSFSTINTKLDAIDDFIDTEVSAIKAKTDNIPANPAKEETVQAVLGSV